MSEVVADSNSSFMEGSRMRATVGLFRDVATAVSINDAGKEVPVKPGQRLLVDLVSVSQVSKGIDHA